MPGGPGYGRFAGLHRAAHFSRGLDDVSNRARTPGRHGVYQFRKMDMRQYGGYRDEFATSQDYVGRSFLELVSQRGQRVASIGVPMTYPPFVAQRLPGQRFSLPLRPVCPSLPARQG